MCLIYLSDSKWAQVPMDVFYWHFFELSSHNETGVQLRQLYLNGIQYPTYLFPIFLSIETLFVIRKSVAIKLLNVHCIETQDQYMLYCL